MSDDETPKDDEPVRSLRTRRRTGRAKRRALRVPVDEVPRRSAVGAPTIEEVLDIDIDGSAGLAELVDAEPTLETEPALRSEPAPLPRPASEPAPPPRAESEPAPPPQAESEPAPAAGPASEPAPVPSSPSEPAPAADATPAVSPASWRPPPSERPPPPPASGRPPPGSRRLAPASERAGPASERPQPRSWRPGPVSEPAPRPAAMADGEDEASMAPLESEPTVVDMDIAEVRVPRPPPVPTDISGTPTFEGPAVSEDDAAGSADAVEAPPEEDVPATSSAAGRAGDIATDGPKPAPTAVVVRGTVRISDYPAPLAPPAPPEEVEDPEIEVDMDDSALDEDLDLDEEDLFTADEQARSPASGHPDAPPVMPMTTEVGTEAPGDEAADLDLEEVAEEPDVEDAPEEEAEDLDLEEVAEEADADELGLREEAAAAPPPAPPPAPAEPPAPPPAPADASGHGEEAPYVPAEPRRRRRKPWFEDFFNDDYLRTVLPPRPRQVSRQCDFMEGVLGLERGAAILDVGCGLGLQALELTARGYVVVGLDLSLPMLSRAADEAQDRELKINFLHGDMREMGFDGAFDAVLCWGTTFGYFDDETNKAVIKRMFSALKPMGLLLLDVVNRDHVLRSQPNLVWFEGDGCVCMEETQCNYITSRLEVKRTVILDDGRQRENFYRIRLYSLHELGQILHQQGFRVASVTGHEATPGVYFGIDSPRMIILAERRLQKGGEGGGEGTPSSPVVQVPSSEGMPTGPVMEVPSPKDTPSDGNGGEPEPA